MDREQLGAWEGPLSMPRSMGSIAVREVHRSTVMTGGRIMIVDDDQAFVDAVTIYLEDHGFCVIKAYTGQEGIRECKRKKVDVAVIDVHLPDLEGPDVARALSRWQPTTQVLLISSDDSPETAAKCLATKAHAFMAKPLIPKQLLETISRTCSLARRESASSLRPRGD